MFKRISQVMILISVFAVGAILTGCEKKRTASGMSCNENLARMDGAKERLAIEKGLKSGAEVKWEDIVQPDGVYTLGKVGEDPTCTCGARLP